MRRVALVALSFTIAACQQHGSNGDGDLAVDTADMAALPDLTASADLGDSDDLSVSADLASARCPT